MKLSELKNHLNKLTSLNFVLPNGTFVPAHYHITEAGLVSKHFIDCGGTVRTEKTINLQLWTSKDTDHRLEPNKLIKILALSEKVLGNEDLDIEVEYQTDTVGKYGLSFQGENFVLTAKHTDCLAKDNCGVPQEKTQWQIAGSDSQSACCSPGGGCC